MSIESMRQLQQEIMENSNIHIYESSNPNESIAKYILKFSALTIAAQYYLACLGFYNHNDEIRNLTKNPDFFENLAKKLVFNTIDDLFKFTLVLRRSIKYIEVYSIYKKQATLNDEILFHVSVEFNQEL
jgi:hypothetical protein